MRRPLIAVGGIASGIALIMFCASCKSPPPAPAPTPSPSPSPTATPTPRPLLSFELEAEGGPLRVLEDGSIALALFGEDGYGEWQMLAYFDDAGKAALEKATAENVDRMMSVRLGEEILLSARIMGPIEDGRMLLTGLSAEQARILKEILAGKTGGK